jgi:hypothetical protein
VIANLVPPRDDAAVRYATAFSILQFGALLTLSTALILHKHSMNRRRRIWSERVRAIEAALTSGDGNPSELAEQWPSEFLAVARHALGVVSGPERERVANVLRGTSAYGTLRRRISAPHARQAADAVRLLGSIAAGDDWRALDRALSHRSRLVRVAALREMLVHGSRKRQDWVLYLLPSLDRWERLSVYNAAPADSPAVLEFLSNSLNGDEIELVKVCLEFVHALNRALRVSVSPALSRSPDAEVRIRFFKALPFLITGEAEQIAALRTGLSDPDWRVRAMAAKSCEHFRLGILAEDLLRLCTDFASPAEAGHAARAVARLGGEGSGRLQSLVSAKSNVSSHIAAEVIQRESFRMVW